MAEVSVVRSTYQGFPGGPGYTSMSFEPLATPTAVQAAVDAVRAFWQNFLAQMKTTWTVTVSPEVINYDLATGALVGEQTAGTAPAVATGTGLTSAAYAGGTGLRIRWLTGVIWQGRHVSGQTWVVPLQNVSDPDGTLTAAAITTATNAANALIGNSSAHLAVWAKMYDKTVHPPVQTSGTLARATQVMVPDKAAILRSRRD